MLKLGLNIAQSYILLQVKGIHALRLLRSESLAKNASNPVSDTCRFGRVDCTEQQMLQHNKYEDTKERIDPALFSVLNAPLSSALPL